MLGLLAGTAPVQAAAPGLTVHPPSVSPGLAEPRIAILIVPVRPDGGPRSVVAHSDEEAYRKRLQEIGFEVWTVGPADRPGLDRSLRDVVSRLPSGAHVAVLALGTALSGASDVHIVPADASPDLATSPALVETETIRLGDVLRRLAARSPRSMVAVVDECQRPTGGTCMLEDSASQASVMAGVRGTGQANGGLPLTSRASLREVLLEGMVQEGHTFVQTFGFVRERLSGSDLNLVAGPSLTTAFSFLPQGFFARLPSECNQVDLNADPTALRGASLDGAIRACEAALATHPYARHFQERLAAAREQRAFQRAITSCEDRLAASAYSSTYPTGRFRRIVDDFVTDCTRRREEQRQSEERRERERMEAERRERERQAQLENERRERQMEAERRERERQEAEQKLRAERQRRGDDARRRYDVLIRTGANPSEFLSLGREAVDAGQGTLAFRAFEEADPAANVDAAWHLARFHDPRVVEQVYRDAARPNVARAAFYYALWKGQSPRHAEELRGLCQAYSELASRDERLRSTCSQ
jgi:hypothetical protein